MLYKLNSNESCTILIIYPYWSSQPCFPNLSSYFVDFLICLPSSGSLLSCPWNLEMKHPLLPTSKLIACNLSANSYLQEKFRQKLSRSYSPAGRKYTKSLLLYPAPVACFCAERDLNSDEPSVNSVLSFSTSLFEHDIGYSQINKARSAL